jgi:aryl carrier-like protein
MSAAPPTAPLEETIAGIWQEFFEDARVSPESDFFGLGGDSVRMMDMLSRVSEVTGVDLSPGALFENPSLQQFSRLVARSLQPGVT